MRIFLCEDIAEHATYFKNIIEQLTSETQWLLELEVFETAEFLLETLNQRLLKKEDIPGLIFLDIELDGMDGIALGKEIFHLAPDICLVFLTAFEEYAIYGYEAQAYRYLLKPVDMEEVRQILSDIFAKKDNNQLILVKGIEREYLLPLQDIKYMSAEDKYVIIYTAAGSYLSRDSLRYYEESLSNMGFFRIHRKHIVNVRHHKTIHNGKVILSGQISLPISRRREAAYHDYFLAMLEGGILQ